MILRQVNATRRDTLRLAKEDARLWRERLPRKDVRVADSWGAVTPANGVGLDGVFWVGFNTCTIGWVEMGDTMKWVGAGWVDDIYGLGRVGALW